MRRKHRVVRPTRKGHGARTISESGMPDAQSARWTRRTHQPTLLKTSPPSGGSCHQSRKQRRRRSEVYLAETRKGEYAMSRDEDLADGLHPNDKGYAKMARAWEAAIRKAVKENENR